MSKVRLTAWAVCPLCGDEWYNPQEGYCAECGYDKNKHRRQNGRECDHDWVEAKSNGSRYVEPVMVCTKCNLTTTL